MNINHTIRRGASLFTITALAATLGGCTDDAGRNLGEDDRTDEDNDSVALRLGDKALGLLYSVVETRIKGKLKGAIFSHFDNSESLMSLSQTSLDQVEDLIDDALDRKEWDVEHLKLGSLAENIDDYARTECEAPPCTPYTEAGNDEALVKRYSDSLNDSWNYYTSQDTRNKKILSIPQMMLLAPIRMMLLQEIVELQHSRGVKIGTAVRNFKDAACEYVTDFRNHEAAFNDMLADYGHLTIPHNGEQLTCYEDGESVYCDESLTQCYTVPHDPETGDGKRCKTQHRSYIQGFAKPQWDQSIWAEMRAEREALIAEDESKIMGEGSFYAIVDSMEGICNYPPIPDQVFCEELSTPSGTFAYRHDGLAGYATYDNIDNTNGETIHRDIRPDSEHFGKWLHITFVGIVLHESLQSMHRPWDGSWDHGEVTCTKWSNEVSD